MEICGHCHNVLPQTVDRCTVCGTARVDPDTTDLRRRDDRVLPADAPGWATPPVPDQGIHPDDFIRELTGEEAAAGSDRPEPFVADHRPAQDAPLEPVLPPRATPPTPPPATLAGYLGKNTHPTGADETSDPPSAQPPGTPANDDLNVPTHLSTAMNVSADGVAARTTRLDGTVKLGPTKGHRLLTLGAPLLAAMLLVGGIAASYDVESSHAEAEAATETIDRAALVDSSSAVVRLDLDGCGLIDQTTGFVFEADQTVLVPRSAILTDSRPTIVLPDGSSFAAEVVGWSITLDLAVIRAEEHLDGGVRWGVSSRVQPGDTVTVLVVSGAGSVTPVPALITEATTINGRNSSFQLDTDAAAGSVVTSSDGFVIGIVDNGGLVQASDDIAPVVSRIVLDNERPTAICPPPLSSPPETDDEPPSEETIPDQ